MSDEKIRAVLERVALEIAPKVSGEVANEIYDVLERRLLPILLAGQDMRDDERSRAWNALKENKPLKRTNAAMLWDSALSAAQGQP